MKSAIILTFLSINTLFSFCQSDTSLPIKVELKLIKSDTFFVSKNSPAMADEIKRHHYEVNGDSIKRKSFDIEITISNTSSDSIFITLMTCSWYDNFLVNNDYMFMYPWGCNSNFPYPVGFKAGEKKIYKITLGKSIKFDYPGNNIYGYQCLTTKLGLIVTGVRYTPKLYVDTQNVFDPMDKSAWRIIWSNPLYLFGEQFQPKPIPVYRN